MPTSIQLSESQRHELAALRDQAEARGNAVGAWADCYGYLARSIAKTVLKLGEVPAFFFAATPAGTPIGARA